MEKTAVNHVDGAFLYESPSANPRSSVTVATGFFYGLRTRSTVFLRCVCECMREAGNTLGRFSSLTGTRIKSTMCFLQMFFTTHIHLLFLFLSLVSWLS